MPGVKLSIMLSKTSLPSEIENKATEMSRLINTLMPRQPQISRLFSVGLGKRRWSCTNLAEVAAPAAIR